MAVAKMFLVILFFMRPTTVEPDPGGLRVPDQQPQPCA